MGVTDRLTCGIHGRVTGICHLCADERHNRDLTAALAAKERAEAMTHEHRSEFLGEIQRRVIELGGDPPYWPARNDIEAHDDVESAARMILELLQERDALAAKLAEDDGMVRVPREPSETMIDAAFDATVWPDLSRATSSDVIASLRENMRKEYRAMLAAAEKETMRCRCLCVPEPRDRGTSGEVYIWNSTDMAASHAKLERGRVWCTVCQHTTRVNVPYALQYGWPKCCGQTMTLDSPDERKEPRP